MMTIYFCFGPYAGFHIIKDGKVLRFVFGWLSIGLCAFDLELYMEEVERVTSELVDKVLEVEVY